MSFYTEEKLFLKVIESSFFKNFIETAVYPTIAYIEPKGFFGIPDLVVANLFGREENYKVYRTFAFEMKLSNWKRALAQAYKYRAFVNMSFVVMDRDKIKPAINNLDLFVKSNIGLLGISNNTGFMSLYNAPVYDNPYSISLQQKFEKMILRKEKNNILKRQDNSPNYYEKLSIWPVIFENS